MDHIYDGFGNTDSTIQTRWSLSAVSWIHLFDKRRDINYQRLYQTVNKEAIVSPAWYGNRTECNMFDKDGVMTHFPMYGSEGQLLRPSEDALLISQIVRANRFALSCSDVSRGSCFDDRPWSNSTLYHILDITNTQWGQKRQDCRAEICGHTQEMEE